MALWSRSFALLTYDYESSMLLPAVPDHIESQCVR